MSTFIYYQQEELDKLRNPNPTPQSVELQLPIEESCFEEKKEVEETGGVTIIYYGE